MAQILTRHYDKLFFNDFINLKQKLRIAIERPQGTRIRCILSCLESRLEFKLKCFPTFIDVHRTFFSAAFERLTALNICHELPAEAEKSLKITHAPENFV